MQNDFLSIEKDGDEGVFLPADEDGGLDPGVLLNQVDDTADSLQRLGHAMVVERA